MTKKFALWALITIALGAIILSLPAWFRPSRWKEITPGLNRSQVHAVLGAPDADFYGAKDFEGWDSSFRVGTSVLIVRYNESGNVDSSDIKTVWGFDYRNWVHEYRDILLKKS